MNNERDPYYTLGLQPGASPDEVKSAFRRLVKLYHPDHDQSLDAEMKYKEISAAYKMLLARRTPSEATTASRAASEERTTPPPPNRQTPPYSNGASQIPKEWFSEHKRLPFELKNIPSIFISSLSEFSAESFLKGIFVLGLAYASVIGPRHAPMEPYAGLAAVFYVVSWILYIFFRYHFDPSELSPLLIIVTGILYGAILLLLIACFYTLHLDQVIATGFLAATSIWVLMLGFSFIKMCRNIR